MIISYPKRFPVFYYKLKSTVPTLRIDIYTVVLFFLFFNGLKFVNWDKWFCYSSLYIW